MKSLGLKYDSILPEEIDSYKGTFIFTTRKEAPESSQIPILKDEIFNKNPTIIKGLMLQKLGFNYNDELIVGIDPGNRMGLSIIFLGSEIERSFFTSVDNLIEHVITILAGLKAKRKIVRIGNGDLSKAQKIINLLNLRFCSHFELELVDESMTSLRIRRFNQRGKRDMMSAKFITQREGYRHFVLPLSRTG